MPQTVPSLPARACRRLVARIRGLRASQTGVAAVEFALILPVLIVLLFGLFETTQAVTADRKLTLLARSLADLSSRDSEVTNSDMTTIFSASAAIMRPFDASGLEMVVTSVLVTRSGSTYTGTVDWSCGKNIPAKLGGETQAAYDARTANDLKPRNKNDTYTVPAGFQTTSTQAFMLVETMYPYVSPTGKMIIGTKRLHETVSWPVRTGSAVKGPSPCP